MYPFVYRRADAVPDAIRAAAGGNLPPTSAPAQFIAGGTQLLDLMKLGSWTPQTLVDINGLAPSLSAIEAGPKGLRLGALVRMSQLETHPTVIRDYPVIAQTMALAASQQLRNMATLAGNILQRTRCQYFREADWPACNKRAPGSGCAAIEGLNRKHAVLGVNDNCIASYPGDFAQALVALGAEIDTAGEAGARTIPFEQLHTGPEDPARETVLLPGELITAIRVPAGPWTRRSTYLKVRDRQSYAFGLATAAVALDLRDGVVQEARIGLGGVAYKPWRAHAAEAALRGKKLDESTAADAARAAFAGAKTHGENAFKVELGQRTLVRALLQAGRMEV